MLLAVDGTGEAYRHYYALPRYLREADYATQDEFNADVGGLFAHLFMSGIVTAIKRIERQYTSEALTVMCWDLVDSKAERLNRFPAYKQHRHRSENIQLFVNMLEDFRVELAAVGSQFNFHCPRWEADDLIAFMPMMAEAIGTELVILSKDSDFKQLLRSGVAIYDPTREQLLDAGVFEQEAGFPSEWALPYKVLVGDSSDNWRGLSGVGPVKATKMTVAGNGFFARTRAASRSTAVPEALSSAPGPGSTESK